MSAKEPADVLEDAAEVIRANGLHKNDFWPDCRGRNPKRWTPGTPVCANGALTVAYGLDRPWFRSDAGAVSLLLQEEIGPFVSVAGWNDSPETTAEEVIELMLGLAKKLRNGEVES